MGLGVHTVLYHLYRRYNKVIFHPLNRQKGPSKSDPNQIVQSANGEWGGGGDLKPPILPLSIHCFCSCLFLLLRLRPSFHFSLFSLSPASLSSLCIFFLLLFLMSSLPLLLLFTHIHCPALFSTPSLSPLLLISLLLPC